MLTVEIPRPHASIKFQCEPPAQRRERRNKIGMVDASAFRIVADGRNGLPRSGNRFAVG